MNQSQGEVVKATIKKCGFSLSVLARRLGISRNTLYTHLRRVKLADKFILEIGDIIGHDFSTIFPYLKVYQQQKSNLWEVRQKYIQLLHHFVRVLLMLLRHLLKGNNELNQTILDYLQKEAEFFKAFLAEQ